MGQSTLCQFMLSPSTGGDIRVLKEWVNAITKRHPRRVCHLIMQKGWCIIFKKHQNQPFRGTPQWSCRIIHLQIWQVQTWLHRLGVTSSLPVPVWCVCVYIVHWFTCSSLIVSGSCPFWLDHLLFLLSLCGLHCNVTHLSLSMLGLLASPYSQWQSNNYPWGLNTPNAVPLELGGWWQWSNSPLAEASCESWGWPRLVSERLQNWAWHGMGGCRGDTGGMLLARGSFFRPCLGAEPWLGLWLLVGIFSLGLYLWFVLCVFAS